MLEYIRTFPGALLSPATGINHSTTYNYIVNGPIGGLVLGTKAIDCKLQKYQQPIGLFPKFSSRFQVFFQPTHHSHPPKWNKISQRWFRCLFATVVAIARGGRSRGVSPSKPSCDSVPVCQNPWSSTSGPGNWPRPVDGAVGQAEGEQDEQEEGEEVAEEIHPELCWQGRGQLWTTGQSRQVAP